MAPEVQVALITTVGSVIVGAMSIVAKRAADRAQATAELAAKRIGEPNGHGTAIQLLERLVDGQAEQDGRLARLEAGHHQLRLDQAETRNTVARVEADLHETRSTVADAIGRIDALERQRVAAAPTTNQQED